MKTGQRKSALSYVPGYKNNAVLQLIIASGVAYIILSIVWALVMIVFVGKAEAFNTYFIPNLALGDISSFKSHWWTVFTYGLFEVPTPVAQSFFELASNMLWLYCFGSVVQTMVGHKQVIPLYIYALVSGGIFYYLAQLMPGMLGIVPPVFLGARAGLMGMAAAAITLTPKYRFYFTQTFSIPLWAVASAFAVLSIVESRHYVPLIGLLIGGGLMGFAYIKMIQSGIKPADWAYSLGNKIEGLVTPTDRKPKGRVISMYPTKKGISQLSVDEILDKINQKGYNSLTKEEKEMLLRAGRES